MTIVGSNKCYLDNLSMLPFILLLCHHWDLCALHLRCLTNCSGPLCWGSPLWILLGELVLGPEGAELQPVDGQVARAAGEPSHTRHQAAQPQGHQAWQPNHAATTVGLEGVGRTSRGRVGWHMQSPVIITSFVEQLCPLSWFHKHVTVADFQSTRESPTNKGDRLTLLDSEIKYWLKLLTNIDIWFSNIFSNIFSNSGALVVAHWLGKWWLIYIRWWGVSLVEEVVAPWLWKLWILYSRLGVTH